MITDRGSRTKRNVIYLPFKLKEIRTNLYADGNALVRRESMLGRRDGGEGEEGGEDLGSSADGARGSRAHSSSVAGLFS